MGALGVRTIIRGLAMQRPHEPGYNRPECTILDDWRKNPLARWLYPIVMSLR